MLWHFGKENLAWEEVIEANILGTVDSETDTLIAQVRMNIILTFTEKNYRYSQNYKKQFQGHLTPTPVKTLDSPGISAFPLGTRSTLQPLLVELMQWSVDLKWKETDFCLS